MHQLSLLPEPVAGVSPGGSEGQREAETIKAGGGEMRGRAGRRESLRRVCEMPVSPALVWAGKPLPLASRPHEGTGSATTDVQASAMAMSFRERRHRGVEVFRALVPPRTFQSRAAH